MMPNATLVVFSRIKQLKTISYYQTDYQHLPIWLNQIVRIEKDRGFHNGKPNGKHFEDWLRVKHPILNFKKGCYSTGLLKTNKENYFNGDFLINGNRIRLTIEFSKNRELLALTIHKK